MVDLVLDNRTKSKVPSRRFFLGIVEEGLSVLGIKERAELGIHIIGEKEIKGLNKKFRGKDKVTNVLSFPLDDKARHGILSLGDIFICLSVAKAEAEEENISLKDRLAWLTIHGLLHLCGLDHERTKKEAQEMLRLESKILKKDI